MSDTALQQKGRSWSRQGQRGEVGSVLRLVSSIADKMPSPEVPPPVDDEADEVDEDEAERESRDVDDEDNLEEATAEDIL